MTNSSLPAQVTHAIADVERDTGLSKDTLRVWERRYGFPNPVRDALGERRYDDAQLLRLRHLRRLLDAGHRPGQVVKLPLDQLLLLQSDAPGQSRQTPPDEAAASPAPCAELPPCLHPSMPPHVAEWMTVLRRHDARGLRAAFDQFLQAHGLSALVREGIAPMNACVGQSWLDGQLAVFEEHLYAECVQQALRQALAQLAASRPSAAPRVMLTTVPGETHALGLLMAECMMVLEGCETIPLGVQTPLVEIVSAASACRADVVALGFSAALNPRDVRAALVQLRAQMPPGLALWTGGQSPALLGRGRGSRRSGLDLPGHEHLAGLDDIAPAVARWRGEHPSLAADLAHKPA